MDDHEAQFAVCTLMTGGPKDTVRMDGEWVTTAERRDQCERWYMAYVLGGGLITCSNFIKVFDGWWSAYKEWTMEQRNE